ncbi:hypothetical protein QYE76_003397 [Lolium multiflorum]|uniref:Uncharacterized protein n=1 Tax=Lolium multiflorum TaxID=4521 RepID=A0AAD8RRD0_LOLMU|nr:hypothetical protein QYE76_003397 [Lolium multiflorum]
MDPTRITTHRLSPTDLVLKAKQICQNPLSSSGRYGLAPYSRRNSPPRRNFRRIGQEHPASYTPDRIFQDDFDVDPYVWGRQQMGRTHTPHPAGSEGQKNKAPATEAGSSHAPPAKRSRQEVVSGRKVTAKHHRKMPVASGPALKITKSASGMKPESSEDSPMASPPPRPSPVPSGAGKPSASSLGGSTSTGRAAPKPPQHRAEGKPVSPPRTQDTGAGAEDAGQGEPLVPPAPKQKKKNSSSPSKTVSESSGPTISSPAKDAPEAPEPPKTAPTPPPATSVGKPAPAKPTPPESATTDPSSGSRTMVLHTGRAAMMASEAASAQIGRITEFQRQGTELGHLLDYAEKWNRADLTPATRGLGKDKLPAVDPSGPAAPLNTLAGCGARARRMPGRNSLRSFCGSTGSCPKRTASAKSRSRLSLPSLPRSRVPFLAVTSFACFILPDFSLLTRFFRISAEKEQVTTAHSEMKEHAMDAELRHARELQKAKATAEAKLDETLKEYTDSTAGLRKELEEEAAARKAAQDKIAQLTADQADYDKMVMQIDALACKIFPESQKHAIAKVTEHRAKQTLPSPDAPWDGYDYLVALSARIRHARSVDRHMKDLPDAALQIFKYDDLDLDAFHALRGDSPSEKDPVRVAKRQDCAYHIAEYAHMRTFIPPPPDVKDAISDDEGTVEDEEDEDAEEGAADPEEGDAPPEAPAADEQPPIA